MKKLREILFLNLFLAALASPAKADEHTVMVLPSIGKTKITAHVAAKGSSLSPFLSFETSRGNPLKLIKFSMEGVSEWPATLRFKELNPKTAGRQLIIAVASSVGGSTINYETTVISTDKGKIVELIPEHIKSASLDALCLESTNRKNHPRLIFFNFLWEDEIHYAPHRYDATIYEWVSGYFSKTGTRRTKRKYVHWQEASDELGFACQEDLITSTNSTYN